MILNLTCSSAWNTPFLAMEFMCGVRILRYSEFGMIWGFEDVVVPHLNEIVEYLDDILFFARERGPPQESLEDRRHSDITVKNEWQTTLLYYSSLTHA